MNMKSLRSAIAASFLFAAAHSPAYAQNAPSIEDAKQAIDRKLHKIWKDIGTNGTRTVLFQEVVAGRSTPGHFPFRATILVHDQETGYPPNHYYGKTCVGRLDQEIYILAQDDFGAWDAQGTMTPDLSTKTCKDNPAAGVAGIPLTSLQGTRAGAAGSAPPARSAAIQNAPGTGASVALGQYQCWGNGQARPLLNFTALANGQYRDNEGHIGKMNVAPATGRVVFSGGTVEGFLPSGYYAVYYAPGGRPTVSFRNSGGSEVQFCQHQ